MSELKRILDICDAAHELAEEDANACDDTHAARLSEVAAELQILAERHDLMCRCITGGYRQNVFDFSRVKDWAFEFTGLPREQSDKV